MVARFCTSGLHLSDPVLCGWIHFSVYKHVLSLIFFSNKWYVLSRTCLHLFLLLYQHYTLTTKKCLLLSLRKKKFFYIHFVYETWNEPGSNTYKFYNIGSCFLILFQNIKKNINLISFFSAIMNKERKEWKKRQFLLHFDIF